MPLLPKRKKRSTDLIPIISEGPSRRIWSDVGLRLARVVEKSAGLCVSIEHIHLINIYQNPIFRHCIAVFWSPQSLTETNICLDK